MFKRFINYSVAAMMCLFVASSCSKDEMDDISNNQTGEMVEVPFSFAIDGLAAGNDGISMLSADGGLTRTVPNDIVDGIAAPIKNLWVIQFDGTSATSKVVGVPHFVSEADIDNVTRLGAVQLMASDTPNYVVWIANLPKGSGYSWGLSPTSTFADVTSKMITISQEADTYATLDGAKTILMNAYTKTAITPGVRLEPQFERNVAKVSLELKMDAVKSAGLEVVSVRLRNIPRNITLADQTLALNEEVGNGKIYPYGSPTIDYNVLTAEELAVTPYPTPGSSTTFSWYVPRNQQGVRASSSQNADKSYYAPTSATHFEVVVKNTATKETAVFRVYPGKNQVDDYNIEPNHHYTTSLNVVGMGDSETQDSRVENFADVNYVGHDANSYILNPMPAGGRDRIYRIPVKRVNQYWSGAAEGYGTAANALGDAEAWKVMLLWCDHAAINAGIVLSKATGTGPEDYFEITVPAGLPAGNFGVKILRDNGDPTTLWSWHFWVTDYNPYAFSSSAINLVATNPGSIPNGVFTYPVPGGQVERYADRGTGKTWSVDYAGNVMMDRALGAVDNYFKDNMASDGKIQGLLHYQYGRKDPFPSMGGTRNEANTSGTTSTLPLGAVIVNSDDKQITMAEAVMNPLKFQNRTTTGQNWCSEVSGTGYLWNDPNCETKSIYDPCPVGWRLPVNGTWSDFNHTNSQYLTTQNPQRDLGYSYGRGIGVSGSKVVNGLRYWPTNATDNTSPDPAGGRIWYSATGFRYSTTGGFSSVGSSGYCWSATPSSFANGCYLNFSSGHVNPSNTNSRAYGFAVRCVSE